MKPELRQLEEQFTIYDFAKNRRMSYYPHNQPITSAGHEADAETVEVTQSTTVTVQPTATIVERSRPGTPFEEQDPSGRETPYPMPSIALNSERQPSQ